MSVTPTPKFHAKILRMQSINEYIKRVNATYIVGNATEHSYRAPLQQLLEALLSNGIKVTNEPKRTDCGAPDFVVTRNDIPLGYIEAKDLGNQLDNPDYQEQFNRYSNALDNLIFTNYLEFRLYRNGKQEMVSNIGEIKGKLIKPLAFTEFTNLLQAFADYQGQTISSAKDLAKRMADKARLLANVIAAALTAQGENTQQGELKGWLTTFRKFLISDIKAVDFADVYAQTIAYGMFAARLHDQTLADFSLREASELIPKSNPFLRRFFQYIAGPDLDPRIQWIIDDLVAIFRAVDVAELMKDFGKTTQRTDPFIHFYETFLGEYDQRLRKSRGVYYTPEPVVSFIVRAVNDLLKNEFSLVDGLADTSTIKTNTDTVHKVQILDPAAGTGTFLAEVVRQIYQTFATQKGLWPSHVKTELIPRLNGFEVMMAPYAMAHLKLEMILQETNCQLNKRLRIFLTNSLEENHPDTDTLFAIWLAEESREAERIKQDTPVMVVLGNPPYSGISSNKGEWITSLIEDYKYINGKHFGERKHWLHDDYVKFIRLGQHYIDRNGEGILAYINNHGFLDNPTFRGMRWHLLRSFDKIYILDLHGNSKKKEVSPDGSPDKNVFDIQQGVSINLFIKTGKKPQNTLGEVFHFDLFGERQSKYEYLWNHSLSNVKFKKLKTPAPYYFFVPKNYRLASKYKKGFGIIDLMPINVTGIVTMGDKFIITNTKQELKKRLLDFLTNRIDEAELKSRFSLGKNYAKWIIENKGEITLEADKYINISYRPFDKKWTYFDNKLLWRWRFNVMRHFLAGENVGLCLSRQFKASQSYHHVFITKSISESSLISNKTSEISYVFPLYFYPDKAQLDNNTIREPNLESAIVNEISGKLDLQFTAEKRDSEDTFAPIDLLDYIYAVLHSPSYRDTYKEFLKTDFPRVPYPPDKNQFRGLVKLGAELRALHLIESEKLNKLITTYPETGDHCVTKIKREKEKVFINKTQYFGQVPEAAWQFYIGGYQPAQKYLKDRKGRNLSSEEIRHYQKIIVALVETATTMEKIDSVL